MSLEPLDKRWLLAATPWTNPLQALDVTGDTSAVVTPLDALLIVNEINTPFYSNAQNRRLPILPDNDRQPRPYLDVDCNGFVTPLDALSVINVLNTRVQPKGWTLREPSSQAIDRGFISSESCGPRLNEGNSYLTELSIELTIPENATNLSFRLGSISFDDLDKVSMTDAFEASLLDTEGRSLVLPYGHHRDSFLNMGEGRSIASAPGVQLVGDLVSLNVSQIPAGTEATLLVRLVNNDRDTQTRVAVRDVQIATTGTVVPINSLSETSAPAGSMSFWSDVDRFVDVSESVALNYRRTSHQEDPRLIHTEIALENVGSYVVLGPVRAIFKNLSDPKISIREADGLTADGEPFVDLSSLINGAKLLPGQTSAFRNISFHNPDQKQFTYNVEIRGLLNDAPELVSEPDTEALFGRIYSHDVQATDKNGDALSFSLISGPAGMSIDASTGVITWRPSASDRGSHSVWLRVEDGFGGAADQTYLLDAIDPPPNRPPVFESTPVVAGQINELYVYQVRATDEDGDSLIYTLGPDSPSDMNIDATSGKIQWLATSAQYSSQQRVQVEIQVRDESGGLATQVYDILLLADAKNSEPVIVSEPLTGAYAGLEYLYDVDAIDAESSALKYTLVASPSGMTIDADLGIIRWTPSARPIGESVNVVVAVTDPDGGTARQAFSVDIVVSSTSIRGNVFHDQNADGSRAANEPGIEQWVVYLDANDNGQRDSTETMTITNASGQYEFGGLLPGRYLVKQERQSGWFPTLPTEVEAAIEVQLNANQVRTGIDFGNRFDGIQEADLQVVDVDSQQLLFDGQALTVAGSIVTTIRNQGRETITKPFEVIFFEDRDRNGAYDRTIDSTLGTTRVTAPLSANSSLNVPASLNGSVLFSGNRIWTYIDSRNEVFETIEDNNVGVHFCEWTPQPGALDPQVEWRKGSFTVAPESNQVMMAPVVIDLDGDGISEILFTTFAGINYVSAGRLRAISGADGREVWTSQPQYAIDPGAGLAVGDIDNDGSPEVVAVSIDRLLVFEHTGQFKFATDAISLSVPLWFGGPSLADLDADGSAEIIMGDAVFANNGSLLWKGGFGDGKGFSIAADLDMDGKLEVVTGSTAYKSDGTVLWHSGTRDGHPAISNLDADPFPEVVVSTDAGSVFALDHEGTLLWSVSLGSMLGTPTLADLDGDTIPEIGVAGATQYTVLSASGSIKWQSSINDWTSSKTGSTVFDFDGDGRSEVVFADQDFLRIYDGTNGSVLYQTPNSSGTLWEYPVIADVDGDGNAEIVAASNNYAGGNHTGITVFGSLSDSWVPTRTLWNQHAYHITNVNDDGTIPRLERPSWLAVNSYRQNRLGKIGDPLPAPDLTISFQRTSSVAGRSDQDLQTIRIGNGGSIHVAAGIHVSVFDADPAKGGKLLGTATTKRRLNPGAFEDVSIALPKSSGKLWFVVDRDANGNQHVRECDESNNVYSTSVLTVAENQSPRITSQPDKLASLGSIYRYFAKAFDRDQDALGFDLVVRPNGMAIDPTSGRIGWFPKPSQLGEHEVILRVRDSRGGVDLQRFTVQVTAGNSSPVITSTAPVPAIDGKNYRYQVRANDVDGDRLTYSLVSGPPGMSIDANTGLVQWRAEYSWSPEYATRFDVDETWRSTTTEPGLGWETNMQFDDSSAAGWEGSSRVGNLNTAWGDYHFIWSPKGNTVDFTWFRKIIKIDEIPLGARFLGSFDDDGELYINGNLVFDDKSAFAGPLGRVDITQYLRQGENLIASRAYDVRGAGRILGLRIDVQTKPFQFEVMVSDGRGGNTTQRVDLPIIADLANRNPQISQEPRTSIRQGDMFRYDTGATDPDGDELQYSLSQAPSGMTVDALGVIQWQPGNGTLGQYPVTLQIRDGRGGALDKQFTLVVTSTPKNNPPEIVSTPNPSAVVGREYRYDARSTDADGDAIIWSLEAAPAGLQITPQQGLVRWTPSVQQIGDHAVVILAEDSYGGQVRQTYSIQVRSVNTPPNIISSPPTMAHVGRELSYKIEATDIDGDRLTYSLAGPAAMTLDRESGLLRWTPTSDLVGIHEITVRVSDGIATSTQSFDLDVTQSTFNAPPRITSTPRLTTVAGSIYRYDVVATDAENDLLTYTLTKSPAGMTIDPRTGVVSWTPSAQQIDLQAISIEVSDNTSGRSIQNYGLRVLPGNRPPVITSEPKLNVTRGARYSYDVRATDPDQQRLTYELLLSPPGMAIDDRGRIRWQTTGTSNSPAPVRLRVADGLGGQAEQNFVVSIDADNLAPQIIVNASPSQGNVGEEMTFVVEDTDNIGVVERTLWIDGVAVPLDATGRVTLKMMRLGSIPIRAEAKDATGNIGRFEHAVQIIDPTDTDAPRVNLTTPVENGVVRSITDVIGTVSDSNLLYYTLSIAPMNGEFREIGRGTSNVSNGVLGKLDPTLLPNDSYRLKVEAFDAGGKSNTDERTISVDGNLKLGNFTVSFNDLLIPVAGVPVSVVRTYDSLNASEPGDFGYGWRMEFRETKLRTSVPETGDEQNLIFNPFFVGAKVFVQLPGGKREGFTFQPRPASGLRGSFLRIYEPAFVPDPGVTSQLTVPNANLSLTATGDVFVHGGGLPFHPSNPLFGNSYVLTTADGVAYDIEGSTGALRSIVDPNGNKLDFSESQIVSSAGPKVRFERDVDGRIVSVIDPSGQMIHYRYNSTGDLISVKDRLGNETKFEYRSDRAHYLNKIIDPLGREALRTEYDDAGRLKRTLDANGQAIGQEYNLANSEVTIVDPLGNSTRFGYDNDGNVTKETNALGEVIRRTYDAAGNVLEETDPLGNTTTRTYDRFGNVLSSKDPLGNVTSTTYGSNNQILSTTDALGNTTRNEYDTKGNLLRTIDPSGMVMGVTYDRAGNPTSMSFAGGTMAVVYDSVGRIVQQTDAMGHITRHTHDTFGNRLTTSTRLTTPVGIRELVTRYEYDANGRLVQSVDAEGGVTRVEYDKAGNKVADIDALGRRTEYRYDSRGLLVETIYPDATASDLTDNPRTTTEYDAAGRATARIDELGRRTQLRYDKAGRLIETIYPDATPNDLNDNPRTRTEYDAAGRAVAQIDERGNRTEFEFDPTGRLIKVRDALGNESRSTYDNAGRRIAITDSLNRVTRFSYDSSGRPIETIHADGTKTSSSFDTNGRLVRRTDPMGRSTRFEHDPLGRLVAVVDALGQRTEYAYDEAGNLIRQTDANGHVTRYEYDGLRRRVATQLPLGQRSKTEYDAVGKPTRATDYNGDTIVYGYDARNRLTSKTFPGGSTVQFSYLPTGLRQSSSDARGTTLWQYDERGRMLSRTEPDGQRISYAYDATGNRTRLTTAAGTVNYTYDVLNRPSTVSSSAGGATRYEYDRVGNLARTEFPNGTTETRQYDSLDRLSYLENRNQAGVISSYRYTLSASGRRDAVEEHSGRKVSYSYDELDRLTHEQITDAAFGDRSIQYSYDPVGNRLTRNDSAEGQTAYTYDDNDRLVSESLRGALTQYTYDNNGNTLSKISAIDRVLYEWDFENRLTEVDTDGNGIADLLNAYDSDGIRVSQKIGSEETRYLIDTVQRYQQVAMEYTPGGVIKVSYVHGLDLISQNRPASSGISFYQVDGLGSTRALTNSAGLVTDRYIYDAFGRTIGQVGTTSNVYLYAGEQRDATVGLDYLRARWMRPATGSFVSVDPFEGWQQIPISRHDYAYANLNPISNADPSGLFTLLQVQTASSSQSSLTKSNMVRAKMQFEKIIDKADRLHILGFSLQLAAVLASHSFDEDEDAFLIKKEIWPISIESEGSKRFTTFEALAFRYGVGKFSLELDPSDEKYPAIGFSGQLSSNRWSLSTELSREQEWSLKKWTGLETARISLQMGVSGSQGSEIDYSTRFKINISLGGGFFDIGVAFSLGRSGKIQVALEF